MRRAIRWTALGAIFVFLASISDHADARGRRGRIWVPQPAWDAAKQRAKLDLGSDSIKVYKSRWSNKTSRGLRGTGGEAYIVHAKKTTRSPWASKTKGAYLVEKSQQGIWEAFPLAPNNKGKHVSKVDARQGGSFQTYADGGFPPSKVVHGLKVKNANLIIRAQLGDIVAQKRRGDKATVFVLGRSNKSGIGAAAQVAFTPRPIFRHEPAPGIGERNPPALPIVPPSKYANVHFNQMYYAQRAGQPAAAQPAAGGN